MAVTWGPLFVLSIVERVVTGRVPSIDWSVHARLLVTIPLLFAADASLHWRSRKAIEVFFEEGWASDQPERIAKIIGCAERLRDAVAPEVILLALALIGGQAVVWRVGGLRSFASGLLLDPQQVAPKYWYALVSLPVFQFLLFRALWRWGIWVQLLWRLSRLRLRPIPTHPDLAGGLLFLSLPIDGFACIVAGLSATQAGVYANQIIFEDAAISSFTSKVVIFTLAAVLLGLGPLVVFAGHLRRCHVLGGIEYDRLATQYTRLFHARWIDGGSAERSARERRYPGAGRRRHLVRGRSPHAPGAGRTGRGHLGCRRGADADDPGGAASRTGRRAAEDDCVRGARPRLTPRALASWPGAYWPPSRLPSPAIGTTGSCGEVDRGALRECGGEAIPFGAQLVAEQPEQLVRELGGAGADGVRRDRGAELGARLETAVRVKLQRALEDRGQRRRKRGDARPLRVPGAGRRLPSADRRTPRPGRSARRSARRGSPAPARTDPRGGRPMPRACSGDMKPTFPFTTPFWVWDTRSVAFTMPKSSSFTSPRAEIRTFSGEMSR